MCLLLWDAHIKEKLIHRWLTLWHKDLEIWVAMKFLLVTLLELVLQVILIAIANDLEKTYAMLDAVKLDKSILSAHFHNTYNRAI